MDPMIFVWSAIGPVVALFFAFPITIIKKDNSLVDIGWALGFISMAWISFLINGLKNDSWALRQIVITSLVTVWGVRLISYIIVRRKIRGTEDPRFVGYREQWKTFFLLKSFLIIFIPQMILVYIVGSPVVFANSVLEPTVLDVVGIALLTIGGAVWLKGFFFETVGDIQLLKFRINPNNKGKTLSTGLWRYSRHPNYFGESTQWWGIFIVAISLTFTDLSNIPQIIVGWVTLVGPALLTFLLVKFSGIPTLEKEGILKNREGYHEYIETTSAFIPWFPRKKKT